MKYLKNYLLTFIVTISFCSIGPTFAGYVSWSNWCRKGDGTACTSVDLRNPSRVRQIVVFPVGFREDEYSVFVQEYNRLISQMGAAGSKVYSQQHKSNILYYASWTPGGSLNTPEALFKGKVLDNPFRGKALTVDQDQVVAAVNQLRLDEALWLRPWAVVTIFNTTEDGITANASPPTQLNKPYGIARMTRRQLDDVYIPSHEVAHAALNFLDEYIEHGMESLSIRSLDVLTPFAIWQNASDFDDDLGNLFGVYQYTVSEILSANGNENMDVSKYVSRVVTPGFAAEEFANEGGMFFGKGTYHHIGPNLMGSSREGMSPNDGFAYDHSVPQKRVIDMTFTSSRPTRPNDRIRNAGPVNGWVTVGNETRLMLFDADKNHQLQKTLSYEVQVGWYERKWKTCWAAFIPYPCSEKKWITVEKSVQPTERIINLKSSTLYGLADFVLKLACGLGINSIPFGGKNVDICSLPLNDTAQAFLPTMRFVVPYQDVKVPASQWATRYFWRFRTNNGSIRSGWTGWGHFNRSF
jgi:hypothetical protein